MTELAAFGRELRRLRTSAGFSQEQLAEQSGVSVRTIRSLEGVGAKRPRPSTVGRLADALSLVDDRRRNLLDLLNTDNSAAPMLSPTSPTADVSPADALRTLRSRLAWTQRTLATKAGLHLRTISDLERGVTATAQPATARRIAVAAGLAQGDADDLVAVLTGTRSHLTVDDRLVGRGMEIARVLALVRSNPLVAITGAGGIGKTALAMAVVAASPGDSRILSLADTPPGTTLLVALAAVLGLDDPSLEAITGATGTRQLLVLDNVEHLTDLDNSLLDLSDHRGGSRILLTSRLPVRAVGAAEVQLEPLRPTDAVELLRQRADRPGALSSWEDEHLFEAICEAVDHIPLSIELVTNWSPMLSPSDVLERLRKPLSIVRKPRNASDNGRDDRQHSVRSVVEWSLALLPHSTRSFFRELAIHPTSFTLDMAEHLHGDIAPTLDAIRELVDVGLLHMEGKSRPARVVISPVVREVAAETFADETRRATLFARRNEWILSLVAVTDKHLTSQDQADWLERLDQERAHLETTLEHLLSQQSLDAVNVAGGLWRYWHLRSLYRHGTDRIGRALAISGARDADAYGTARYGRAILTYLQGDVALATSQALEALAVFTDEGDEHGRLSTHSLLGMIDQYQGRVEASERWYRSGLAGADPDRNERAYVTLLSNLASLLAQEGDFSEAFELTEEAAARYESMGDERTAADQLGNLGLWYVAAGDPYRARTALHEVRGMFSRLAEPAGTAESETGLAEVALYLGELDEAQRHLDEAERLLDDLDEPWGRSLALSLRATLSLLMGETDPAIRQAKRALHLAGSLPYANAQLRAHLVESVGHTIRNSRLDALRSTAATLRLSGPGNPPALAAAALLATAIVSSDADRRPDGADKVAATATGMSRSFRGGAPAVFDLIRSLTNVSHDGSSPTLSTPSVARDGLAEAALDLVEVALADNES